MELQELDVGVDALRLCRYQGHLPIDFCIGINCYNKVWLGILGRLGVEPCFE
jgi:hypothetical protein